MTLSGGLTEAPCVSLDLATSPLALFAIDMAQPSSLYAFEGLWTLSRVIRHESGLTDSFNGECEFTRSGHRLIQDERGVLITAEGQFDATRRYIWSERNDRLEVQFDDMRPFHTIPLNDVAPRTVHLCDPDRYQVTYDFAEWPVWRTVWAVEGPRKGYVMETEYAPKEA